MKISLAREGIFDPRERERWKRAKKKQVRDGTAEGMRESGEKIAPELRANLRGALNLKSPGLASTVRANVYQRGERMPVLYLGSAVPWLGIHEHGGTIKGPLLVPLVKPRISGEQFRARVTALIKSGQAFFKNVNGKVILFVREGRKITPLAVLVDRVTIRKGLNFESTVRRRLGDIARAIERGIEAEANG